MTDYSLKFIADNLVRNDLDIEMLKNEVKFLSVKLKHANSAIMALAILGIAALFKGFV